MNRFAVSLILVLGLAVHGSASGAQIDVFLIRCDLPNSMCASPSTNLFGLSVNNNGGANLGAVNLLTSGNLTSMTLNPLNTGISVGDSSFTIDPLSIGLNFAIISNASAAGTIAAAGAQGVLLAILTRSSGPVTLVGPEVEAGQDAVFDNNLVAITNYTITVVPEPSTTLLLGIGLAALALLRRAA